MAKDRKTPKDVYREAHGITWQPAAPDEEAALKHVGGGVFELPNGERVKGRADAEARMDELAKAGDAGSASD